MSSFFQAEKYKKENLKRKQASWKHDKTLEKPEKSSRKLHKRQSGGKTGEQTATSRVCSRVRRDLEIKAGSAQPHRHPAGQPRALCVALLRAASQAEGGERQQLDGRA